MGKVVAKRWAQAQTGGATITFDTIEGGDFLVSGYVAVNSTDNAGNVNVVASWTDDIRAEAKTSENLAYDSGSALSFVQVIHANPITGISIGIGGDAVPSGSTISYYLLIEALSNPEIEGVF